jgi:hypothetical protein
MLDWAQRSRELSVPGMLQTPSHCRAVSVRVRLILLLNGSRIGRALCHHGTSSNLSRLRSSSRRIRRVFARAVEFRHKPLLGRNLWALAQCCHLLR